MGRSVSLQAIVPTSELMAYVRSGVVSPERLFYIDMYYWNRRHRSNLMGIFEREKDPEYKLLYSLLEDMLKISPGIDTRHCSLYKNYHHLCGTLEHATNNESDKHLARSAIYGQDLVTPNVKAICGYEIMCNSAETCQLVNVWLSEF